MRPFRASAGIVFLASLAPTSASANEHARARLHYEAPDSCPDESTLRQEVLARLGYDPFDDSAPRVVTAAIRQAEGRRVATVSLREASGTIRTREPLTSTATRCDELASSVVLAVSIAIDPMSFTRPRDASSIAPGTAPAATAPAREPLPAEPAPAARMPEYVPSKSERIDGWLGAAAQTSVGLLPSASFGVEATGLVERRMLGLRLGARYDFPASTDGPIVGTVRASTALGSIGLCLHWRVLLSCGVGSAGALFGESRGISHPSSDQTFYASAGGRIGAAIPFTRHFALRIELEGGVPLFPTSLDIAGREAWHTPAFYGSLAIGFLVRAF